MKQFYILATAAAVSIASICIVAGVAILLNKKNKAGSQIPKTSPVSTTDALLDDDDDDDYHDADNDLDEDYLDALSNENLLEI